MKYDAVLIAGPTASGKSAAALDLALHIRGTILNADSMQVYRELRVLTARPSPEDEARVSHRLYGHVSVKERYSVGRYQDDALHALANVQQVERVPVFVGGTGLYFDVLTKGLSPIPPVEADIRDRVREKFARLGRDAFYADLMERDPETAGVLRPSDTQRLLRAADVLEATGRSLSLWREFSGKPVLEGLKVARFVVAPSRDVLAERSVRRVEWMFAHGALDEARATIGLDPSLPAAKALGLPQLWRHLSGEWSLEKAAKETEIATRQYVKRQMTWFRNRMKDWTWLEDDKLSNIISQLKEYCL
jgi:tRNA dimethylallyltransferase